MEPEDEVREVVHAGRKGVAAVAARPFVERPGPACGVCEELLHLGGVIAVLGVELLRLARYEVLRVLSVEDLLGAIRRGLICLRT